MDRSWGLGALAAALLLPGTLGTAAAGPAGPPAAYAVTATAVGVAVQSTQRPVASIITADLVDESWGFAASTLTSAGADQSEGASYYPGNLVSSGPQLLCSQFFPCPAAPPDYPLLAEASYPDRAHAVAPQGTGSGLPQAGRAEASAAADTTSADVATAAAAPAAPVLVTVGAGTAATRTWVDAGGAHARSASVVHDVDVGALHVAALTTTEQLDVTDDGRVRDAPEVLAAGVTVAGIPATVDQDGLHLAGSTVAAAAPVAGLDGVDARLIGASAQNASGGGRGAAGGLLVTFSAPVSGVPSLVPGLPDPNRTYLGSVLVGGAGAAVVAGTAGAVLPDLAATAPNFPQPAMQAVAGLSRAVALSVRPAGGPGAPPAAGLLTTLIRRTSSGFDQPDLRLVALVLATVPLGGLLLWRVAAAARRRA